MTRAEALTVLGIADATQANAAFRKASVGCHPDGPTPDAERWTQITQARNILTTPTKCPECKEGRVVVGGLSMFCANCKGTGRLV